MRVRIVKWLVVLTLACSMIHAGLAAEASSTFVPKKILSGENHTCLLSTSGQVKCWGQNKDGELGLGSTVNVGERPDTMGANLSVVDLGKDVFVKDMCAGRNFSCALSTTGRVKCWGLNYHGQLGQEVGNFSVGSKPDDMGDNLPWTNLGTGFVATDVQCGSHSTCAINTKGQVKCWGYGAYGQLGRNIMGAGQIGSRTGDMGDKLPYLPLPPVKSVSLGSVHTCVTTSEAVYCFGNNQFGQAGIESLDNLELPADFRYARKVKLEDDGVPTTIHSTIAGDNHTCVEYRVGATAKKKTKCWGYNEHGQIGVGSSERDIGKKPGTFGAKLPELQLDSSNFVQMENYDLFSCALKRNGSVQCWGSNYQGELGLGDTIERGGKPDDLGNNLKHLDLGLPVRSLSHGSSARSVCALLINHEIKCWGFGKSGQLGYEDNLSRGGNPSDMGDNLPFVRYK